MSDLEPKISIIVPVYNVSLFLKSCLDSVLDQDYSNYECILVDDGSTDCSGSICDEYVDADSRFRVIHQSNQGLSAARNNGIRIATGLFSVYIDSDDVIASNFISMLVRPLLSNPNAVSAVKATIFTDGEVFGHGDKHVNIERVSPRQGVDELLSEGLLSTMAVGKMAKTEYLQRYIFPLGRKFEDLPTTWKILADASDVFICFGRLYGYRKRPGSISSCASIGSASDYLTSILQLRDEALSHSVVDQQSVSFRICLESCRLIEMCSRVDEGSSEAKRILGTAVDLLRRCAPRALFNGGSSLLQKARILLYCINPSFCCMRKMKY